MGENLGRLLRILPALGVSLRIGTQRDGDKVLWRVDAGAFDAHDESLDVACGKVMDQWSKRIQELHEASVGNVTI